jgi:hypothetical protein
VSSLFLFSPLLYETVVLWALESNDSTVGGAISSDCRAVSLGRAVLVRRLGVTLTVDWATDLATVAARMERRGVGVGLF